MKPTDITRELLAALRRGDIDRARNLAEKAPAEEHDALYAQAFLDLLEQDYSSARVQHFFTAYSDSPYVAYMQAYLHLVSSDEEKALYLYTQLVELPEGWLARELIEKSKKNQLIELAASKSPFHFIPIPEKEKTTLLRRIFLARPEIKARGFAQDDWAFPEEVSGKKLKLTNKISNWRHHRLFFSVILLLVVIAAAIYTGFLLYPGREKSTWQHLKLDDSAHILPEQQAAGGFRYGTREQLLEDFRQARAKMAEAKVNQARYLLQRMLLSNADFRSREKARLFLNFIPVPEYTNFSDNVPAVELLQEPQYRSGSYLVWEGDMKLWKKESGGYRGQMVITEKGQNYLVEIFWPDSSVIPGSKPEDFYEEQRSESRKAIVFGQFKGLVGSQKLIYIEALRVWF